MRMLKCWLKGHWKGVEVFLMTIDNLISCLSNMQQHEKPSKQIEKVISEGSKVITSAPWWKHFLIWTINFSIVLRLVFALPCFICVRSLTSENLCLFPSSERGWSRQPKIKRMMFGINNLQCHDTKTITGPYLWWRSLGEGALIDFRPAGKKRDYLRNGHL